MKLLNKIEQKIRGWLSYHPIFYGFIGGIGMVLFWRGVWHTTDFLSSFFLAWQTGVPTTDFSGVLDGPISFVVGTVMLVLSGVFVSALLGNEIIISGLRGEERLTEKTEMEVRTETGAIAEIRSEVRKISRRLVELDEKISGKK